MVHALTFGTGGYAAALADHLVDVNRNDVLLPIPDFAIVTSVNRYLHA